MREGAVVPKLTNEECMGLMLGMLSDPGLHARAAEGYKKTGQSIDLRGFEDALICREAAVFWHEQTASGHVNVKCLVDSELEAVAEEFTSGGLAWCQRDVGRLTTPYPSRKDVDRVLEALGDVFYHDEIHDIEAEAAEVSDGSSSESDAQGAPTGRAGDGGANGADDEGANAAVADDACTELARVQDQTP